MYVTYPYPVYHKIPPPPPTLPTRRCRRCPCCCPCCCSCPRARTQASHRPPPAPLLPPLWVLLLLLLPPRCRRCPRARGERGRQGSSGPPCRASTAQSPKGARESTSRGRRYQGRSTSSNDDQCASGWECVTRAPRRSKDECLINDARIKSKAGPFGPCVCTRKGAGVSALLPCIALKAARAREEQVRGAHACAFSFPTGKKKTFPRRSQAPFQAEERAVGRSIDRSPDRHVPGL